MTRQKAMDEMWKSISHITFVGGDRSHLTYHHEHQIDELLKCVEGMFFGDNLTISQTLLIAGIVETSYELGKLVERRNQND